MSSVVVPEHSRPLLEALSAGRSFELDSHVFVADGDWLMAIGYPLEGAFSVSRFEAVLNEAIRRVRPADCFAIAPGRVLRAFGIGRRAVEASGAGPACAGASCRG